MSERTDFIVLNSLFRILDAIFDEFAEKNCCHCPKAIDVKSFTIEMGCCAECGSNNGYFDSNFGEYNCKLEHIKNLYEFNTKTGFFDPEKPGCRIPRKFRSSTCLLYCCDPDIKDTVLSIIRIIEKIRNKYGLLN